MAPDLSSEAWAQIRSDYEHTDTPVEDICAEHGISSGTLRDRMRRWGWMRRRAPVPRDGPPPIPGPPRATPLAIVPASDTAFDMVAPSPATAPEIEAPSLAGAGPVAPCAAAGEDAPPAPDNATIVPRLQSAIARVLPAIEATVARLGAGPTHPRELEQAARALASLTRTLRELTSLLRQHQAPAAGDPADDDPIPEDIDEFRLELARRMNAFVDARTGKTAGAPEPQGP